MFLAISLVKIHMPPIFFWPNMFTFPFLNISPSPFQWLTKKSRDIWAKCIYVNNAKGLLTCQKHQSKTPKVQRTQGPSRRHGHWFLSSHFRPHCPISHHQQETRHWPGSWTSKAKDPAPVWVDVWNLCLGSTQFTTASSSQFSSAPLVLLEYTMNFQGVFCLLISSLI